ncbi:MAG TPA: SRPBCC domain-containing protein [Polyangiaceae bacterium]|nr:SRPBCC domain-containing protein [Polyangiaceae bacterium]
MQIRTEIEIEAPARAVWKVLTDFPRYGEWNPFIVAIHGELAPGARLSVRISQPETNVERTFRPRVLRCEPERELTWLGHLWMRGLLDGEHFLRLDAAGPERTRVVHGQDLSGLLLRYALASVTRTTRGIVYMNQALKRRVESLSPAPRNA